MGRPVRNSGENSSLPWEVSEEHSERHLPQKRKEAAETNEGSCLRGPSLEDRRLVPFSKFACRREVRPRNEVQGGMLEVVK